MSDTNENIYILKSVDNALRVIEALTETEEIGITDLSKSIGIAKSTAFRLLSTLEKWGYVRKNEDSKKYRLGMKFSYIGAIVSSRQEIVRYSRPYLEELSWKNNESAHLVIMEDDYNIRFIDKVLGGNMIHMESFVGARKPSYCTGTGKALLSQLPPDTVLSYLEQQGIKSFTSHTITKADQLLAELKRTRERGYAVDNEESEIGLTCYAAPIFDASGKAIAAISLSGPTSRMLANKKSIVASLKDTSKKISDNIS